MTEQLVTSETLKLARKLGFDGRSDVQIVYGLDDGIPTQSLVQKWLRDEHNIWVTVSFGYKIQWEVRQVTFGYVWNMDNPTDTDGLCDTYEDAIEQGLQSALKLLSDKT